jgi:hypothetical protein
MLEIKVGHGNAPLAFALVLKSSTHIKIENEIFCNSYKETRWIPTFVKLALYSLF